MTVPRVWGNQKCGNGRRTFPQWPKSPREAEVGEVVDKGHSRELFEDPAESRLAQMRQPGPLLDSDGFRIISRDEFENRPQSFRSRLLPNHNGPQRFGDPKMFG